MGIIDWNTFLVNYHGRLWLFMIDRHGRLWTSIVHPMAYLHFEGNLKYGFVQLNSMPFLRLIIDLFGWACEPNCVLPTSYTHDKYVKNNYKKILVLRTLSIERVDYICLWLLFISITINFESNKRQTKMIIISNYYEDT